MTYAELMALLTRPSHKAWWRSLVLLGPRAFAGVGKRLRWRVDFKRSAAPGDLPIVLCWDASVPKEEGAVRGQDVFESVEVRERSVDAVVNWAVETRARQLVRAVEVEGSDIEVTACSFTFLVDEGAGQTQIHPWNKP